MCLVIISFAHLYLLTCSTHRFFSFSFTFPLQPLSIGLVSQSLHLVHQSWHPGWSQWGRLPRWELLSCSFVSSARPASLCANIRWCARKERGIFRSHPDQSWRSIRNANCPHSLHTSRLRQSVFVYLECRIYFRWWWSGCRAGGTSAALWPTWRLYSRIRDLWCHTQLTHHVLLNNRLYWEHDIVLNLQCPIWRAVPCSPAGVK